MDKCVEELKEVADRQIKGVYLEIEGSGREVY